MPNTRGEGTARTLSARRCGRAVASRAASVIFASYDRANITLDARIGEALHPPRCAVRLRPRHGAARAGRDERSATRRDDLDRAALELGRRGGVALEHERVV